MKIYCNLCKNDTNHNILFENKQHQSNVENDIWVNNTYQVLQCAGCDTISFRKLSVCSEDIDSTGQPILFEYQYPHSNKNLLTTKYLHNLPNNLKSLYKEIIDCFNNGNYILCAAGIRAIIEGICIDNDIIKGNLHSKIDELYQNGILTNQHSIILHKHRCIGNSAIHELSTPSNEELLIAIEILEHTLENIYDLQFKAYKLNLLNKKSK